MIVNLRFFYEQINLDEYKKENKQVQQHLEEDEVIEPILIPLDHFVENIKGLYFKLSNYICRLL